MKSCVQCSGPPSGNPSGLCDQCLEVLQALNVPPLDSYEELELRCQVAVSVASGSEDTFLKLWKDAPAGYGKHLEARQLLSQWATVSVLYEELAAHPRASAGRKETAEKLAIEAAKKAGLPLRFEALTARMRSKYPVSVPRG